MSKFASSKPVYFVLQMSGARNGQPPSKARTRTIKGTGRWSEADAVAKAKKLAESNPGDRFYVLKTTSAHCMPTGLVSETY